MQTQSPIFDEIAKLMRAFLGKHVGKK